MGDKYAPTHGWRINLGVTEICRDGKLRRSVLDKLNLNPIKKLPKPVKYIGDNGSRTPTGKIAMAADSFIGEYLKFSNFDICQSLYPKEFMHDPITSFEGVNVRCKKIKNINDSLLLNFITYNNWSIEINPWIIGSRDYKKGEIKSRFNSIVKALPPNVNPYFKKKYRISKQKLIELDKVYTEYIHEKFKLDIKQLRDIIELFPNKKFKAKYRCITHRFNPELRHTFDVLLDDCFVEIKTVQDYKIDDRYICQLMLYYILYRIGGVRLEKKQRKIRYIAIYFARQGVLWKQSIESLISEKNILKFIEWFKKEFMYNINDTKRLKSLK